MQYLEWTAVVISVIGSILVNYKKVQGFYLWIISDLMWLFVAFNAHLYGQSVLWIIFIGICVHGILNWRKS